MKAWSWFRCIPQNRFLIPVSQVYPYYLKDNSLFLEYIPASMARVMGVERKDPEKGGGPDFEAQYKWNPFEELMIYSPN